ncbi:MAG TPA: SGNH/GDSL hydrolase family protein [Isosphaeraceae bacterium]|jgi:lysophospholipase L1-like esterase|nr:SGNH/GDSL hydrolase family protein [Isosphaeraceae bacterium]
MLGCSTARADAEARFELIDGDRVVLIGNTFVESDQSHGYLETLLTARWPDRTITFRNLGWSGDTVFGEARARFGTPADGFQHLKEHVLALRPTVIFVGYGANEAFEGKAGLPRFLEGLNRLLEVLDATKARVIFLSPIPQEDLGRPLPEPRRHNHDLRLYRDALKTVASKRGNVFIDMYELLGDGAKWPLAHPLTDDSIHLTAYGYWNAAQAVAMGLSLEPPKWRVAIGPEGKVEFERGTKVTNVRMKKDALRFEARDTTLPGLPIMEGGPPGGLMSWGPMPVLQVRGLAPGHYRLAIDGKPKDSHDAQGWASAIPIVISPPEYDQVEQLRQATVVKNRLYFYRWRPQNETYLFGFRKHEQGQNAREIPLFDPLVEEQEKVIARLRVPFSHVYELTRENEVAQ